LQVPEADAKADLVSWDKVQHFAIRILIFHLAIFILPIIVFAHFQIQEIDCLNLFLLKMMLP